MGGLVFRRAVITGGSSGIGLSIAAYLFQQNTELLLIARDPEKLEQAAAHLKSTYSQKTVVKTLSLDIADRAMVEKKLNQACSTLAPDLLINCAGMAYPDYFQNLDSSIFDATIQTNLTGTWNILKTVVPHMKSGSRIVNVSSVAGLIGTFGYTAYAATKFGIIGLSEALRNELSLKGIRVSVLCPPDTDTPQLEKENLSKPPETRAISGNAGILKPDQVAKELFKGLRRNRFIIIPGFQSNMIYFLKRFFPGIVFTMIDMYAKKPIGSDDE
ncbi:MAG: SDR family oxidoreductase [Spirochaetia bacterium]|nr:SDR family oxidoreductase [Spirochaetia bacterium]